jgi:ABC-2 type transport system permease protein
MTSVRIFFIGGLTSYRALFGWLSPWILIPTFLVAPLFQILLFTYIGRAAAFDSDEFYVIGNAVQYAALPCVFAMTSTIAGERGQRTLAMVLGLIAGAIGFRVRETAVLSNIVFGLLLIFCGVNVPLDDLPQWMSTTAHGLPLTHGIEAARRVADGDALGSVAGLVGAEFLVGVVYIVAGLVLLRFFERQGRRYATLERA